MKNIFTKLTKLFSNPTFKVTLVLLALFVLTYIFIDHVWYAGHQFLFSNDTRLPLDMKAQDNTFFYVWTSNTAPGNFDAIKLTFIAPIGLIVKFFYTLSLPLDSSVYQKIIFTSLLFFSGFSFYYLIQSIAPSTSKLSKTIGAFVYTINFGSIFLWIGLSQMLFRYSFYPLILAIYIKNLQIKNPKMLKNSIILAVLYTATITPTYQTIPFIILDFLFLFLYLLFFLYLNTGQVARIKSALLFSLTTFVFWCLLNMFYILPLTYGSAYMMSHSTDSPVEIFKDSNSLFQLNSSRVSDSIRLMGYWAFGGDSRGTPYYHWYKPYLSNPLLAISFLIPVISFLALFARKYRSYILFFGLTLIIFIFFLKGSYDPLSNLNHFIFSHFNLITLFRSGYQRFIGYIALSLIVLFTLGLDTIQNIKIKHHRQ